MLSLCTSLLETEVGSCYLEVSFGTTGVGNLVLPGVSPGVTWALPGVTWVFYFGVVFFFVPKKSAFLKLKLLEENQISPGDVTWAHACSRYLSTWPTHPLT